MTAVATADTNRELARTPSVLAPLIKEQIQLGDLAAEEAGMPYYRKAGALLLEAQISKKASGEYSEEWFDDYCEKTAHKSMAQCRVWIRAHKEQVASIEHSRINGKSDAARTPKLSSSLSQLRGAAPSGRVFREWTAPVDAMAETARKQQARAAEDRQAEQQRKQQLARKLIDIGFKVLAKELHPDKMGGNKEAMSRLNEVRNRLMQVYG